MRLTSVYQIPCNQGGLNHNPNIDMIPSVAMVHPSRNINLNEGGRKSRGGTSKVNASAGYGGARIVGAYDFRLQNNNQFQVVATADGKIWKDTTTTLKTGWTIDKHVSFSVMNNVLYICNGANRPQVWDGSAASTSDLTNIPTDWVGTSFPFQMIVHGKGASERMWAIGAKPNTIYASKLNNGIAEADFSDANVLTFYIETGDNKGITGGVEFGDRLIVFSKRQAYMIDDTSTNTAYWGYYKAPWTGGLANYNLIVKTPNDLIAMTDDGDIYSVVAVESYGDYKAASIVRPAFLDRWIREYINLTEIDNFHAVYNPTLNYIDFFMVYKKPGVTNNNLALRYFINLGPLGGWMPQDNQSHASGYDASCSFLWKVSEGKYEIRTGDYSGYIWKLETANKNDDGNGYYAGFKTPHMPFGDARTTKHYKRTRVVCEPRGNWNIQVKTWVDGNYKGAQNIVLGDVGAVLDEFVLDTDVLGGQELTDTSFENENVGKRVQYEIYNSTAGETFFISNIMVDFKPVGVRL